MWVIGPVIAEVMTGGSQRTGFSSGSGPGAWKFPVPVQQTADPVIRKLKIAKPGAYAQHPAVAAPPASASPFQTSIVTLPSAILQEPRLPLIPIAAQIAAEADRKCQDNSNYYRYDDPHPERS